MKESGNIGLVHSKLLFENLTKNGFQNNCAPFFIYEQNAYLLDSKAGPKVLKLIVPIPGLSLRMQRQNTTTTVRPIRWLKIQFDAPELHLNTYLRCIKIYCFLHVMNKLQ